MKINGLFFIQMKTFSPVLIKDAVTPEFSDHFTSLLSVVELKHKYWVKALNISVNESFQFLILNTFIQMSKIMFLSTCEWTKWNFCFVMTKCKKWRSLNSWSIYEI